MTPRGGTHFRKDNVATLTERQRGVMRLLQRGQTNGQIAEALGITLDGAKFHVAEIIGRLGVTTREEAVEAWRRRPGRRTRLAALPILRWTAGLAGGAAAVAVAVITWVALTAGDGEQLVVGGPSPAAPASPSIKVGTAQAPCPATPPVMQPNVTVIDWIDFVRFNGVTYWGGGWGGPLLTVLSGGLGPEYARVAFTLEGNVQDSTYRARDCDASFLPAGTSLFPINGYDPRFRIALANGKVYESYTAEGIRTAGEITDLRGKVTRIEFRTNDTPPVMRARLNDPGAVARLVDDFLAARFDDSTQPTSSQSGPDIVVVFVLADATEFARVYRPASGWAWPGIWLPVSFNDAATAAMAPP
jgi:DNA-binding CsgD family transcriptional regulator